MVEGDQHVAQTPQVCYVFEISTSLEGQAMDKKFGIGNVSNMFSCCSECVRQTSCAAWTWTYDSATGDDGLCSLWRPTIGVPLRRVTSAHAVSGLLPGSPEKSPSDCRTESWPQLLLLLLALVLLAACLLYWLSCVLRFQRKSRHDEFSQPVSSATMWKYRPHPTEPGTTFGLAPQVAGGVVPVFMPLGANAPLSTSAGVVLPGSLHVGSGDAAMSPFAGIDDCEGLRGQPGVCYAQGTHSGAEWSRLERATPYFLNGEQ